MDFLQKYQKEYFPELHKSRYQNRIQKALELGQQYKKTKQLNNFDYQDIRTILRVFKHYKIVGKDQKHEQMQKQFFDANVKGFSYGIICCSISLLIKQFYKMTKLKKNLVLLGLFSIPYGCFVYPKYQKLRQYNLQVIKQNINKFDLLRQLKESEKI